jgi:hypothetical protein
MDPITLILTALTAGVAAATQTVAGDTIKDAYSGLKHLLQQKLTGKPGAEVALQEHETDPSTWEAPLRTALMQTQVDQDEAIMKAAQKVLTLVYPQYTATDKYNVQITGNSQGLRLCCKNSRGNTMGEKPPFLFSLGRHSKQAGDERNLPQDVPFFHPMHLPLANDVHTLISL